MKVSDEYKLSSLDDPKRKAFERKRNYPLKIYETTLKNGQVVRIMANDHYEAREKLQQVYGIREVVYVPKIVAH